MVLGSKGKTLKFLTQGGSLIDEADARAEPATGP
jgi:hypothetical protein